MEKNSYSINEILDIAIDEWRLPWPKTKDLKKTKDPKKNDFIKYDDSLQCARKAAYKKILRTLKNENYDMKKSKDARERCYVIENVNDFVDYTPTLKKYFEEKSAIRHKLYVTEEKVREINGAMDDENLDILNYLADKDRDEPLYVEKYSEQSMVENEVKKEIEKIKKRMMLEAIFSIYFDLSEKRLNEDVQKVVENDMVRGSEDTSVNVENARERLKHYNEYCSKKDKI